MRVPFSLWLAAILLFWAHPAKAQTLFPALSGQALRQAVQLAYTPISVYGYDRARDTLFARVELEVGDSLRCVYTTRAIRLDLTQDPTTFAYNSPLQISTEHVWPQSRGTSVAPAVSDMHHLYPVNQSTNSARGNNPFGYVASPDRWYGPLGTLTSAPSRQLERYSTRSGSLWEVNSLYRGDIARAMFYVYTIYAATVDSAWIRTQQEDLLAWHELDPPSAADVSRSGRVKHYQGNDNPFVLDVTLARRILMPGSTPLPVELVAFGALVDGREAFLAWRTEGETNNAGFQVEHATGDTWQALGFVPGNGTTEAAHEYHFRTAPLEPGVHRFRLRQTDFDGMTAYSGIVEVWVAPDAAHPISVRHAGPNPARDAFRVAVQSVRDADVSITLHDALGREVYRTHTFLHPAQVETITVPAHDLAPGVYLVQARTGDGATTVLSVVRQP